MQPDPPLAAVRQNVDGVVLVRREVHTVAERRRAPLVDLDAQRRDLVARIVQSLQQPGIALCDDGLVENIEERLEASGRIPSVPGV